MNYRDILKIYKLERELAPDDLALLNTLREMPDAVRELFAETLGPPVQASATKQRQIEHCDTCDYTKRHSIHKDATQTGYHEFRAKKAAGKKSARAALLSEKIQGTASRTVIGPACAICGNVEDHLDHDVDHYLSAHEFDGGKSAASPAPSSSSTNRAESTTTATGD